MARPFEYFLPWARATSDLVRAATAMQRGLSEQVLHHDESQRTEQSGNENARQRESARVATASCCCTVRGCFIFTHGR